MADLALLVVVVGMFTLAAWCIHADTTHPDDHDLDDWP